MAFVIVVNTVRPPQKLLVNDANIAIQQLLKQGHHGESYRYFGGKLYPHRRF